MGRNFLAKHLLMPALLVLGSWQASAQETPAIDKIDDFNLEDLLNIEVSAASKSKQKQYEAPAIVSVIGRDQFYDYGYFNLNEAVAREPGFFPAHDYDRSVLGSRGLSEGWNNNHILLLMDGVPFNDPMYGSAYTWENTPTFMFKSVEVIRGPGSALYGTNATNGVIAVQTMSGSDMKGKAEGRVRAGSHDSRWYEAYTGNTVGNFNYFTGFSSYTTAGNNYASYDASGLTDAGGAPVKNEIRDARSAQYLLFKVEGEKELKGFSLQFHDQQNQFQTGHGWLFAIPDTQDSMKEHRQVATLSYAPHNSTWKPEFTVKYERKEIDWLTRYYPAGSNGFANGMTEYVNFQHENYFGRGQLTYELGNRANILGGVESNTFVYNGDKAHYSNLDFNDTNTGTNQKDGFVNAGPILGLIKGKPITNIGLYTQFMSGDMLGKIFQLTAGLRYDIEQVNYDATLIGGTGTGSRTFKQFSPRIALVVQPTEKVSLKLMAGRAFRAPAPSELAGMNTYALANNITALEPETVETFEAGVDYRPTASWNFKANAYHTKSSNQIGYSSSQNNLSANIYTIQNLGAEGEASYTVGRSKSFANVAWVKRLGESIADTTVTGNNDTVTWAPVMTANIGLTQAFSPKWKGTLALQYMDKIIRRESDNATAANVALRGSEVPAYYGVDASVLWQIAKGTELNVYVKNVFDKQGYLIKTRDYSFDYQMDGRTYYAALTQSF